MKLSTLALAAALCAATVPAFAGQNFSVSLGAGHSVIGGHSVNQASLSMLGVSGPVLYGASFADGNHHGVNARSTDLLAGYALPLKTPGLLVAPTITAGYDRLNGAVATHVAVGTLAGYTFQSGLTLTGSAYAGRAFGTHGLYASGAYASSSRCFALYVSEIPHTRRQTA